MTTLTETAYHTRKAINYGIIGLVILIFLRIGISAFTSYWKKTHPQPPPPPNVLFGKLPSIEFPANNSTTSALSYKLDTVIGGFPKLSDQAKVYFMPPIPANLVGLDIAREQAKKMGFEGEPERVDERIFRFKDLKYPARVLTIDIVNGNFKIFYNYLQDESVFAEKDLPGKERAIVEAKNLLNNFQLLKEDIGSGEVKISYLKIENGRISQVASLLEANFTQILFSRKKIDDLPVYFLKHQPINYQDEEMQPISIIFSGSKEGLKRLISLDYNYQIIDYENFATYPVITPQKAFEDLKAGRGYIANYQGSSNLATIREVSLAYLDSDKSQNYLQPIYVFTGDDNFVGFVPAVKEEWFNKTKS